MDYTLADLTKFTGAKRRTIQHWSEVGVLLALPSTDRGGTGVHRRFSKEEAVVACLVNAYARRLQMTVGVLLRVSKVLRDSWKHARFRSAIEKAIERQAEIYVILRTPGAPKFVVALGDGSLDF
jgi:hypothetical protein